MLTGWKNRMGKSCRKSSCRSLWNLYLSSPHLLFRLLPYLCLTSPAFSVSILDSQLQVGQTCLSYCSGSPLTYIAGFLAVFPSPLLSWWSVRQCTRDFFFWTKNLIKLFFYWTKSHHLWKSWNPHVIFPDLPLRLLKLTIPFSSV